MFYFVLTSAAPHECQFAAACLTQDGSFWCFFFFLFLVIIKADEFQCISYRAGDEAGVPGWSAPGSCGVASCVPLV